MRNTLGRTEGRMGDNDRQFIGHEDLSTASGLNFFLTNYPGSWKEYDIIFYNMEKPSIGGQYLNVLISTNGATFEVGAAYDFTAHYYGATTAAIATGSFGAAAFNFQVGTLLALATATGRQAAYGRVRVRGSRTANVDTKVEIDWFYLNSASSPSVAKMVGTYASGPLAGIQLAIGAGSNFSLQADIYGVGRLPTG